MHRDSRFCTNGGMTLGAIFIFPLRFPRKLALRVCYPFPFFAQYTHNLRVHKTTGEGCIQVICSNNRIMRRLHVTTLQDPSHREKGGSWKSVTTRYRNSFWDQSDDETGCASSKTTRLLYFGAEPYSSIHVLISKLS